MASPTRKRVADDDHAATSKSSKRQRSKQKLPADGEARDDFDGGAEKIAEVGRKKTQQQEEPETPFGKMDGQLIADYMARQIKRFEPDLSVVELEDRRVPGVYYSCPFACVELLEHDRYCRAYDCLIASARASSEKNQENSC